MKIKDTAGRNKVSNNAVFYFGNLDRPNLDFLHQTLSMVFQSDEIITVYCSEDQREYRPQIQAFLRDYSDQYELRQLDLTTSIPGWLANDS